MEAVAVPRARTGRAAALHRRAAATATAASEVLDETRPVPADQRRQYELADRLRSAATILAPGWAGAPLETLTAQTPPDEVPPSFVVVGTAAPLDDARFPALVPLLGSGHLTVDTDARDARVAGLLRAVLLRLFAATPAGCLLVRAVDGTEGGEVFAPFGALADAGPLPPPALDVAGLRGVLGEAEQWVAPDAARPRRRDRTLLLVVSAFPAGTGDAELARLAALARSGPSAGLHLVLAGWPGTGRDPLPHATPVTVRNAYALVGDPPGASFGGVGDGAAGGLNAPVFLAEDPPAELVETVCRHLAEQVEAGTRLSLADLLPEPGTQRWAADSAAGLSTTVGDAGGRPVPVGFTELTPHWLVSGRSAAGRSAFLTNVLLGLAARYGPEELTLHLADLGPGEAFVEFLQTERDRTWIPQVRSAAMAADREYVLDLFDALATEVRRRAEVAALTGGQRFADLREHLALPRIVCVVDNLQVLFGEPGRARSAEVSPGGTLLPGAPADRSGAARSRDRATPTAAARSRDGLGATALASLDTLARAGRAYGVHLLLAGEDDLGLGTGSGSRDSMLGQFPVRVALPGGGAVLEPSNDAAAGLPVGSAVVNTAGGLGGPQGATRGHERMIRFPDPEDAPTTVEELRRTLWTARPDGSSPPLVFAGYARPLLRNDPCYRAALLGRAPGPAALLGRAVDVARSTVAVPLGPSTGRNLAVLGPGLPAARLLATATRATAAHHPPGTARFVIACLVDEAVPVAGRLAAELAGQHAVTTVDRSGLAHLPFLGSPEEAHPGRPDRSTRPDTPAQAQARTPAQVQPAPAAPEQAGTGSAATGTGPVAGDGTGPVAAEGPIVLVVFGLDAPSAEELPRERVRALLRDGPPAGTHLLGWWRTTPSFAALLEPDGEVDKLAAVVAVDVPGAQLAGVFGRPVQWRPRPARAVLWDGPDEQGRVLVPFALEDEEDQA
ncbi:cell division protein FtsK [Micromonospora rosaria]|uniref:Cell division protein FtsK n=1 Tax=Micromonospora rosaria TaxID=47874 RepID=A0A136PN90_9ACTN|nr:FtsK/SpoIIIE domain-containing protein [Micromonospora rosaria]KXK59862.1 cell division protein FtsK [Micromonospora rosaria]